jgi:hypothetical protein
VNQKNAPKRRYDDRSPFAFTKLLFDFDAQPGFEGGLCDRKRDAVNAFVASGLASIPGKLDHTRPVATEL